MAGIVGDISSITLIDGSAYGIKDGIARTSYAEMSAILSSIPNSYAQLSDVSRVYVKDPSISEYQDGKQSDLSVLKVTIEEYASLLQDDAAMPNAIYVISDDFKDAYGAQLKNLAVGTDISDAVTVWQLNQLSGSISQRINQSVSVLSGSISALSGEIAQCITSADLIESITWSALVNKRNNSQLVPGKMYRIIDYVTTTNGNMASRSAGNQFDIIVTAIAQNKLSEIARADYHEGTSYFNNSNMQAWKIWYRLDNDADFDWAVTSANGGKGVIYRMIDEFNNDVPYDFKNIQFRPYGVVEDVSSFNALPESGDPSMIYYVTSTSASYKWNPDWTSSEDKYVTDSSNIWYYTFSNGTDDSTVAFGGTSDGFRRNAYNNHIKKACCYYSDYWNDNKMTWWKSKLNRIVMLYTYDSIDSNSRGSSCNTFEDGCYCITCNKGFGCNTFGNNCHHMRFGNGFDNNTFGKECAYIKFVNMPESDISAKQNYIYKNYVSNVTVEDRNCGIILNMTGTTSDVAHYCNMTMRSGIRNVTNSDVMLSSDVHSEVKSYKIITDPTNGGQTFNTIFKPKNSWEISV